MNKYIFLFFVNTFYSQVLNSDLISYQNNLSEFSEIIVTTLKSSGIKKKIKASSVLDLDRLIQIDTLFNGNEIKEVGIRHENIKNRTIKYSHIANGDDTLMVQTWIYNENYKNDTLINNLKGIKSILS